jgi:hypothetical protein
MEKLTKFNYSKMSTDALVKRSKNLKDHDDPKAINEVLTIYMV